MNVELNLNLPSDLAIILGVVLSIITFTKGVTEYSKQGIEKRANLFMELEEKFFNNASFVEICELLDSNETNLASINYKNKIEFVAFFEHIALLVNSGLLNLKLVSYVYGYYIVKCCESDHFWSEDLDRKSEYWMLFFALAEDVKSIKIINIDPRSLKI